MPKIVGADPKLTLSFGSAPTAEQLDALAMAVFVRIAGAGGEAKGLYSSGALGLWRNGGTRRPVR